MGYPLSTTQRITFDQAVQNTRKGLAEKAFGTLAGIDMETRLDTSLGDDMKGSAILEARNPPQVHSASNIDRQIGLLLPCNVVVLADISTQKTVNVVATDPQLMVKRYDEPELREAADDAAAKLRVALNSLSDTADAS